MKRRAARSLALAGALGAGSALSFLAACGSSTDRSFADAPDAAEAGFDHASVPVPELEASAPIDAADDYQAPDGAVVCDASPCVVSLVGAASTYCALRSDGVVSCWGNNIDGQLAEDAGDGIIGSGTPHAVSGLAGVTSLDVGDGNACARIADGGVLCWGNPDLVNAGITPVDGGALFDTAVLRPTRETALPSAQTVGVGVRSACLTTPGGALTCWGKNASGELARTPSPDPYLPPAGVNVGSRQIASVFPADSRTFAITTAGELLSWGTSSFNGSAGFLLGRDTSEDPDAVPGIVPGLTRVRAVASGTRHSCAVVGRFVDCWGLDDNGQLGRGPYSGLASPPAATRVSFTVEAEDVDAGSPPANDIPLHVAEGDQHGCAVMGSGRVYCWGDNQSGQLGSGINADNSGFPVHITELDGPAVHLASGRSSVCALLRAGVVECWGANFQGDLGRGNVDDLPHPHPRAVVFPP